MDKASLATKKIVIASYAHLIHNKYTTLGGPALALKEYLIKRAEVVICIWQPLPISDTLSVIVETLKRANPDRVIRLPFINWPFGRNKAISFIYVVLKLRDIVFTLFYCFIFRTRCDIFIGVEAVNALIGVLLRIFGLTKTTVYYNLDYGKQRFNKSVFNVCFHFLDRMAVYYSDYTWTLSPDIVTERTKHLSSKRKDKVKQLVVPIGVHFNRINRQPLEKIKRKQIVYLGTLMKQQGVQLIIEALPEILARLGDIELFIVGSGEDEDIFRAMAKENRIDKCITFTGIVSDEEAERLLCESAIGLAPYVDDVNSNKRFTEPTKPKTYLSCGLPIVITRVPSIADEIEKRRAGIVIRYDAQEMAKAVIMLLSDETLYEEYRRNAIAFASEFEWNQVFDKAFANVTKCLSQHMPT